MYTTQGSTGEYTLQTHTHNESYMTEEERKRHVSVSAHPGPGCDRQACSSASLPAAGALCTEVVGHETPHE